MPGGSGEHPPPTKLFPKSNGNMIQIIDKNSDSPNIPPTPVITRFITRALGHQLSGDIAALRLELLHVGFPRTIGGPEHG